MTVEPAASKTSVRSVPVFAMDSQRNKGKSALVTGANKGIGREVARQLARRGFRVFLGARDPIRGQAAADEIGREEKGAVVEFLQLDVFDAGSITRAVGELKEKTGGALDVLVNNAAIMEDTPGVSVLDIEPAVVERTLQTNVFGPLRLIQACAPLLAASERGGRIINLSSGLGQLNDMESEYPAYSISKTALNALTRQSAAALKDKNVSVNSVCPGWVRTDMGGTNATRSVEEGADTVVWLAVEAPAKISGEFLRDRKTIPW